MGTRVPTMVKYAREPANPAKVCKARGSDLRVHFKNTRETAAAIKGMQLNQAVTYLNAVLAHKRIIPFRHFTGKIGHKAQAKEFNTTQGRWPEKSVKVILGLLENAAANAEAKQLEKSRLRITHIQVNEAVKQRRRTYRAHGRVNAYLACPSHVELWLEEDAAAVARPADEGAIVKRRKVSQKALARERAGARK
eukprot:Amastigsp_a508339_15395.p2 type:complete len:194 gc:universal Amastigsp_a508339_15395:1-582(+)